LGDRKGIWPVKSIGLLPQQSTKVLASRSLVDSAEPGVIFGKIDRLKIGSQVTLSAKGIIGRRDFCLW